MRFIFQYNCSCGPHNRGGKKSSTTVTSSYELFSQASYIPEINGWFHHSWGSVLARGFVTFLLFQTFSTTSIMTRYPPHSSITIALKRRKQINKRTHWNKINEPYIIIIIIIIIVHFAVPADHRINLKESEKKDKYLDLARGLKKLWNMKVTIVPIVIDALGTITKGLLKGLEDLEIGGRVETIQTTALLRTARILRRVLETWGDLLSLKLQCKTIS